MRKIIAAMNITLDGYCDHTAMIADDEVHDHYTTLLRSTGVLLYGRTTYQLMESFWPTLVKQPSGNKASDDFALIMENIPKMVFSRTLGQVGWNNVTLAKRSLAEEVMEFREQTGDPILIGSPSLISQLTKLRMIDEYQLAVHPVITGSGLRLFRDVSEAKLFKLISTKRFGCGVMLLYYESTPKP